MKCFLSHSSKDKESYVRYVANKFGDRAVYDEYNFEFGMPTLSEIMNGLEESDLFVLFISENSLRSEWVKNEITLFRGLSDSQKIRKFLPILIDNTISHSDNRIPSWLRENYNIRYVAKPTIAVRRINTVFNQISLAKHKILAERRKLFVGRNKELELFERRIDDHTKKLPSSILVSGMRDIGRKSFLIHALKKSIILINFIIQL